MNQQYNNIYCFLLLFITTLDASDTLIREKNMSSTVNYDVCDLNLIYNERYQYSLPRKVLEEFFSGKAFGNREFYTPKESKRLGRDINQIYQNILSKNPLRGNLAVMTAGALGAGKTFQLRKDLEANELKGKHYAYVCPDDVCLKSQKETYLRDIESSDQSIDAGQKAYKKWRPGSNAAAQEILGNLIREKYAFYFGTTSSGSETWKFFEFLKTQGYRIRLIHVSAPDKVRWDSINERDRTFVQSTEQEVNEKKLLLTQRINDTFLKYADEIEFYYRSGVKENAILAATWLRNEDNGKHLGTLQIIAPDQYEQIKTIHNEAAKVLTRDDLFWESTVEQSSKILASFKI